MFVAAALATVLAVAGLRVLLDLTVVLTTGVLRLLAVLVEAVVHVLADLAVGVGRLLAAGWRRQRARSLRDRALAGR